MTVYRARDEESGLNFFRSQVHPDGALSDNSMSDRAVDDRFNAALCRIEAQWLGVMVDCKVSEMTADDDTIRSHIGTLVTRAQMLDDSASSIYERLWAKG